MVLFLTIVSNEPETLTQCCFKAGQRLRRWPSIKTTLCQRLVFTVIIVILKLGERLSYWSSIKTPLGEPLVFTGIYIYTPGLT